MCESDMGNCYIEQMWRLIAPLHYLALWYKIDYKKSTLRFSTQANVGFDFTPRLIESRLKYPWIPPNIDFILFQNRKDKLEEKSIEKNGKVLKNIILCVLKNTLNANTHAL